MGSLAVLFAFGEFYCFAVIFILCFFCIKVTRRQICLLVLVLLSYYFVFIIRGEVVTLKVRPLKKILHFILVKVNFANVAVVNLVIHIMCAHFATGYFRHKTTSFT